MIGLIQGTIIYIDTDTLIVDVAGVGYEVHASIRPDAPLHINQSVALYIYTHVREDALILFGFTSKVEKELFQKLLKVSGIGAKTALLVLSTYPPEQLISIIAGKNTASLCAIKGIGKKAAEKIILELADKMNDLSLLHNITPLQMQTPPHGQQELISALVNLGYKQHVVEQTLSTIEFDADLGFDQRFKLSLKQLSK
ncbi:MAG: Holliday junction branch migration protein RuvA [Deltaproteobacteria bacterium]|nr:Holliday junction branch migration protein RuvA [Deltaproteobacteria bacterium]